MGCKQLKTQRLSNKEKLVANVNRIFNVSMLAFLMKILASLMCSF